MNSDSLQSCCTDLCSADDPPKHLHYRLSELERKMGTLLHRRQLLRVDGPGPLPDQKGQRKHAALRDAQPHRVHVREKV